jgi:hypothetical protein
VAEEVKVAKAAAAKKRKTVDDEEVMAEPSKKSKGKAHATSTDHEPELAESPCQR